MPRVLKEPEERKTEILDAAEELFHAKGYAAATTGEILAKTGIARGTLYYHFTSKEQVMEAVIEREISRQIEALLPIVNDGRLNALEKLQRIFSLQRNRPAEDPVLEYLHQPRNAEMHQKSLVLGVRLFAPVLAGIFRQGVEERLFQTEQPVELAEFVLVGMNFLLDPAIFTWSPDETAARLVTLADILESCLRAAKGSFAFLVPAGRDKHSKEAYREH